METYIEYRIKIIITAIVFTVTMENWRISCRAHMKTQLTELMLHIYIYITAEIPAIDEHFNNAKQVKEGWRKKKNKTSKNGFTYDATSHIYTWLETIFVGDCARARSSMCVCVCVFRLDSFDWTCINCSKRTGFHFFKTSNISRVPPSHAMRAMNFYCEFKPYTLAVPREYIRKHIRRLAKMYFFDGKALVWWNMQEW